jgi:transcriptional regulator with XRE-family HTH domain
MDKIVEKRNKVLADIRKKLNVSQETLANYLNISRGTFSFFETFKAYPSDEMQRKLCGYFSQNGINVSKKDLFPEEKYEGAFKSSLGVPKVENNVLVGARRKLGLSKVEISEVLGLSNSSYSDYENLQRYPSKNHQKIISEYFVKNGFNLLEEDIFPKEIYTSDLSVNKYESTELEFISLSEVDESKVPVDENEYFKEEIRGAPEGLVSKMINSGRYILKANGEKTWVYNLRERERSSLTEHYINCKTFEEIGLKIKVSGARAQQLANKGVKRLKLMRHKFYDDLDFDRDNKVGL